MSSINIGGAITPALAMKSPTQTFGEGNMASADGCNRDEEGVKTLTMLKISVFTHYCFIC